MYTTEVLIVFVSVYLHWPVSIVFAQCMLDKRVCFGNVTLYRLFVIIISMLCFVLVVILFFDIHFFSISFKLDANIIKSYTRLVTICDQNKQTFETNIQTDKQINNLTSRVDCVSLVDF